MSLTLKQKVNAIREVENNPTKSRGLIAEELNIPRMTLMNREESPVSYLSRVSYHPSISITEDQGRPVNGSETARLKGNHSTLAKWRQRRRRPKGKRKSLFSLLEVK